MTLKKLLLATTAVAMLAGIAAPAMAQTTLRLVSKDLLSTNPDDVKEIEAIEAALKAQGVDVDIQTIDLPGGTRSGLKVVQEILVDVPDIHFSVLTSTDVVRHKLVGRIVDAYERWDARQEADEATTNRKPVQRRGARAPRQSHRTES